ncbi:hypothetical protein B2J93_6847 [Marssonina coronariae]|uniref:Myb-like domain-containing protein n=1 Tax=Diplocarpon coronariae TaxID=2795749 RepID=A0A218YWX8_9HELO|nr:hypothetical protein B2J93_6847 [Marssonina coronariae]
MPPSHRSRAAKKNKVEISFTNWVMGGSLLSLNTSSSLGRRNSLHQNKHSSDSGFEDAATDDEQPAKPAPAPSVSSNKSQNKKQPDEEKPKEVKSVCAECKDNDVPPSEKCSPNCPVCNEECTWEKHMHEKYGYMTCNTCGRGESWLKDEFHKGRGEYACEKCTPDCETCGRGPLWLNKKWRKTLKRKTKIIQGNDGKKDGDGKKGGEGDGEEIKEKDQAEKGKDGGKEKMEGKGKGANKEDEAAEKGSEKKPEPEKVGEQTKNAEPKNGAEPKKDGGSNIWTPEQDAQIKEMQAEKKSWKAIAEKVGSSKQACIDHFRDLQRSGDPVSEKKDEAIAQGDTQSNNGGGMGDAALMDVPASGNGDGLGAGPSINIANTSGGGGTGTRENQNKGHDKQSETGKKDDQNSHQKKPHSGKRKNKGSKQGKDAAGTSGNRDNNETSGGDGWGGNNTGKLWDQNTTQNNDGWGAVADVACNDQPSAQNNDGWDASVGAAVDDKPADQNNDGWGAMNTSNADFCHSYGEGADDSWGGGRGNTGNSNAHKSTPKPTPPAGGYFTDSNPIATSGTPPVVGSAAAATGGWEGETNCWVNVDTSSLNGDGGHAGWEGRGRGNMDGWNNVSPPNNNNGSHTPDIPENKHSSSGWAGNTGEWTTVDDNAEPADNSGGNTSWDQPDNSNHNRNSGNSWSRDLHDTTSDSFGGKNAAGAWNQGDTRNNTGNSGADSSWSKPNTPAAHNAVNPSTSNPDDNGGAFHCGNHLNSSDYLAFNDSAGRKSYCGKLRPSSAWTADDCAKLEHLDRMHQYRWAHIQKGFYDWTGRMISAELIERKFKDDGAA